MKKVLALFLLLFGVILVSCKTTEQQYTITYYLYKIEDSQSYTTIEKEYLPDYVLKEDAIAQEREGYKLEGWYLDADYTDRVSFPYIVSKNTDFYAKWIKTYKVTFINENKTFKTVEAEENKALVSIENPEKEGYAFLGWSSSKDTYTAFDFSTLITENKTLYAFFTPVETEQIHITFKDGDTTLHTDTLDKGTTAQAYTAPTKPDLIFKGWSTDKDTYTEFNFSTLLNTDTTLYAFYDPISENEIVVTFKDGTTDLHTTSIQKGSTVQAFTAPTKMGYTFRGWSTDKDTYAEFDFSTLLNTNTILYAFYTPVETEQIHIIFKDGDTTLHTDTLDKGATAQAYTAPTKPNFIFRGWSTDKDTYNEFDFTTSLNSDTTLYAFYTPVETISVIFVDNTTTLHTEVIEKGDAVQAFTAPVKPGYTFRGWSSSKDTYTAFDFSTPLNSDTTLYAFYDVIPEDAIIITFKDGTTDLHIAAINKGDKVQAFTAPSKTGYTFRGWSSNKDTYNEFDFNTSLNTNTTLYAFYTKNTYSVTFYNGNVVLSTTNVEHNETVTLPSNPSKTGYTFKGWSLSNTTYTPFNKTTGITKNTNLFAYFEINTFTVKFINGSIVDTQTIEYNSTIAVPTDPVKTGYIFKGWSTNESSLVLFNVNTKITKDYNLYAFFVEELTITFTANNKSTTTKIEKGTTVSEPENPTLEGKSFIGWYYNDTKFDFTTKINESIELVARFEEVQIEVSNYSGYNEGLFFEATPVPGATINDYAVSYKLSNSKTWNTVDQELIREENNLIRCDVVGLTAGTYDVKIDVSDKSRTLSCTVEAQDRSGYAHFNYSSGIGAYNDDGTLKSDAIVVYVTNETKNTVSVGGYTGLVSILQNQSKIGKPLNIRIIGKITTNQYNYKSDAPRLPDCEDNSATFFNNSLETTYGENLVGLTVQYMDKLLGKSSKFLTTKDGLKSNGTGTSSKKTTTYTRDQYPELTGKTVLDDDSYFNMLDIEAASNISLEGIGTNAEFFQFGLTWKKCNSIEVKNLTFTDYPEDACSFEAGSNSDVNNYGHYWVHNNTFNRGKNNWDVSGERDKYAGDGGIDLKYINSVTLAYNKFNNCKKTGLVGGSNDNRQKNITFHHNYYYKVESRLPLGRQANMHIYNNYYEECGTCQDIRANAFVFSEANYFQNCTSPQKVTTDSTYKNTVIKSYNDYFTGSGTSQATKVTSRTQSLTGNCKPDGSTDYSNFDTNSTLFYYTGSASDVSVLHNTSDVPEYCKTYSGVLKSVITPGGGTTTPDPDPQPPVSDWTNKLNETFSSTKSIQQATENFPTTSGIHYYTDATDNTKNNLTIENGSLHINDTSDKTTWGHYNFESTAIKSPETGKVRISVDFIPPKSSSKWTIIQFMDGENNIYIRTDGDKKLGYTINGETNASGLVVHPIDSEVMVVNKTYTVVLTIDYDTNEAVLSINGGTSVKLTGYTANKAIYGLTFMTAGSDTARSYTVDNILIDWAN